MKPKYFMMGRNVHEPARPPSAVICDLFLQHQKASKTDSEVTELARSVLLPVSEVQIWLEHLQEVQHNHKQGAAQVAITKKTKKVAAKGHAPERDTHHTLESDSSTACTASEQIEEDCFCEVCRGKFEEETEKWIACDKYDNWSHWTCVGISEEPDKYICSYVLDHRLCMCCCSTDRIKLNGCCS